MKFTHAEGRVQLAEPCLAIFEAQRQRTRFQCETGGQLFARFLEGALVVERATCVRGARGRFSFHPNRVDEQREIETLFQEGLHYVGDWHTHPEGRPTPSGPDRTKMLEIFRQSEHQLPLMLMAIVGLEPFPEGLYLGTVNAAGITQLRGPKAGGSKVAAKYRDPETGATWSGRGKAPKWIAGQERDKFVI